MKRFCVFSLILAMFLVLGLSFAGCSTVGNGNSVPSKLRGTYSYKGEVLFRINADGTGSIGFQDGYSVETSYNGRYSGEVRFSQGSTEIGRYTFLFNGDFSGMWIQSGTGPFAAWANIGVEGREYVISKKKR